MSDLNMMFAGFAGIALIVFYAAEWLYRRVKKP